MMKCVHCNGNGYDPDEQPEPGEAPEDCCPVCEGWGLVKRDTWDVYDIETGAVFVRTRWRFLAAHASRNGFGLDYGRTSQRRQRAEARQRRREVFAWLDAELARAAQRLRDERS